MDLSVVIPRAESKRNRSAMSCAKSRPQTIPNEIIVVDNGSTDRTAERASAAGAQVVVKPTRLWTGLRRGGSPRFAGMRYRRFPRWRWERLPGIHNQLVDPIIAGTHDFVIGSRTRGQREPGSMNFQQIVRRPIAGLILRLLYGVRYTDMCPFRAIRRDALDQWSMKEKTYGWNLEMQMKAARAGLRILEIPVNHRCRAGGESKVSGTLRGTFVAGARIIATLLRIAFERGGTAAKF